MARNPKLGPTKMNRIPRVLLDKHSPTGNAITGIRLIFLKMLFRHVSPKFLEQVPVSVRKREEGGKEPRRDSVCSFLFKEGVL